MSKITKKKYIFKKAFRFGFTKSYGQVPGQGLSAEDFFFKSKTYILPIHKQLCRIGSSLLLCFKANI